MASRFLKIAAALGVLTMAFFHSKKQVSTGNDDFNKSKNPGACDTSNKPETSRKSSNLTPETPECNFINYELRRDQTKKQMFSFKSKHVYACAPGWVQNAIYKLESTSNISKISELRVHGASGGFISKSSLPEIVPLSQFSKLIQLQLLSRNEQFNVDGIIKTHLYAPGIKEPAALYSLKDLARQTVIVGEAWTKNYGGYKMPLHSQACKVFICDLAALQFQKDYNTGRLVLVRDSPLPAGILDDMIYTNIVGEQRKSFKEALKNPSRFVKFRSQVFGPVLFDTFAYKRFVARDVVLAGLALNDLGEKNTENINFKFLKYGTGYFAADFGPIIEDNILDGVLDGVDELFGDYKPSCIKSIELPFYTIKYEERISFLEKKYHIKIIFSNDDALKCTKLNHLVTATTNCGDPHAVLGNEMKHQSVDAAIAENLKDKGNQFCPIMNKQLSEVYFTMKSKI